MLVSTSIFDPAELPSAADSLASYGIEQIKELADFYGSDASITYHGVNIHHHPLCQVKNWFPNGKYSEEL